MQTEKADPEQELIEFLAKYQRDPLGFVVAAFPWGEKETELAEEAGPRTWQREVLSEIGDALRKNAKADVWEAIRHAVASGHGIGKSALVSWLCFWAMSTFENCRGVVTANTEGQLRSKTQPEIAKWHRLLINKHWFVVESSKIESVDPVHGKNWRIDLIPWNEINPEAFQGLHNKRRRILLIFDEASAIHDKIWEVSEGALTDEATEMIWCVFGNPTRQNGRFRECFRKFKHRWKTRHIDSRNVEGTNKVEIAKIIEDRGEDDDIVRIRVRGEFPKQADHQLISQEHVAAARKREGVWDKHMPIVAGLDCARSGSADSVLSFRCGRNAKSIKRKRWHERDSVALAGYVAFEIEKLAQQNVRVHTLFVDGGGLGGPIADILKHAGYPVVEVNFGQAAQDAKKYFNAGSEMWGRMADWMKVGAIEDDAELETQLVSRDFFYALKTNQISLVSKDKMEAEGIPSPDDGDSLALTFHREILPAAGIQVEGASHKCLNDLEE